METRSKRKRATESENMPCGTAMNLRSKRVSYNVIIDFDEASREWNANKCKIGNGCYMYNQTAKTKYNIVTRSQSKNM